MMDELILFLIGFVVGGGLVGWFAFKYGQTVATKAAAIEKVVKQ